MLIYWLRFKYFICLWTTVYKVFVCHERYIYSLFKSISEVRKHTCLLTLLFLTKPLSNKAVNKINGAFLKDLNVNFNLAATEMYQNAFLTILLTKRKNI